MHFGWKHKKTIRILTLSSVLTLLLTILPLVPATVVMGASLMMLNPDEGRIGDLVQIGGAGFINDQGVQMYFSSDRADIGDEIDARVTAYKYLGQTRTVPGSLVLERLNFWVPDKLTDGRTQRNVVNGDYYVYATYLGSKRIVAAAEFFVPGAMVITPGRGRISDWIGIDATGLTPGDILYLYFSSDKANVGHYIDSEVKIYEYVGLTAVIANGTLGGSVAFQIPSRLTDGKFEEDVHGGEYYFYTTYYTARTKIATVSRFVVLDGEISLEPTEGPVGTEVKISGQGLRGNQKITIRYGTEELHPAGGDVTTDSTGRFNAAIVVPQSAVGYHLITAFDVTGNKPEAPFRVKPKIILSPASAIVNQPVEIRGTGFGEVESITLTVNGERLATVPAIFTTDHRGAFTCNFAAPPAAVNTTAKVEISDKSRNKAEAQLTVLPLPITPASINLTPVTSLASPGYVGLQVTVGGVKFTPNTAVTVTYGRIETTTVATANTDIRGDFSASFAIPPGPAGNYMVMATDGANTTSATFVMESTAPPPPVPLVPKATSASKEVNFFDWEDVPDPSGVIYTLQIATDTEFTNIVLEKKGLTASEYTLTPAEQLQAGGATTPYYCRVRATDRAGNEGSWTTPVLFYVGLGGLPMASWLMFTLIGLGVVLVGVVIFWVRRMRVSR